MRENRWLDARGHEHTTVSVRFTPTSNMEILYKYRKYFVLLYEIEFLFETKQYFIECDKINTNFDAQNMCPCFNKFIG